MFSPLDWVERLVLGSGRPSTPPPALQQAGQAGRRKQVRPNSLLEIAGNRVKDVPSEFFTVATHSNMQHSSLAQSSVAQSSVAQSSLGESSHPSKATSKRNYKRRKSLFRGRPGRGSSTPSLQQCPVYLYTSGPGLTCLCG